MNVVESDLNFHVVNLGSVGPLAHERNFVELREGSNSAGRSRIRAFERTLGPGKRPAGTARLAKSFLPAVQGGEVAAAL